MLSTEELYKLIEDEMRDTVVLAFANILISSTATRSSKELILTGAMRIFGGVVLMAHAATVLSPETLSRLQHLVLDFAKLTWATATAATPRPSGGVAAGLVGSGGFGVALPCASAKHSRVLLEVVDDCSSISRRSLSS